MYILFKVHKYLRGKVSIGKKVEEMSIIVHAKFRAQDFFSNFKFVIFPV